MKVENIIIVTCFVATAVSLSGCSHSSEKHEEESDEKHHDEIVFTTQQAKAAGMMLEEVTKGEFCNVIKVSGQIEETFGGEQTIAATADGIVTFANSSMAVGSSIGAGQTIASISSRNIQNGDPLQKMKSEYESAKREMTRSEELVKEKIISQKEYEQARLRYETARAAFMGTALSSYPAGVRVSSPVSGFVKSLPVKPGSYVSVGDPIAVITRNRRLQLRAEVPESEFGNLNSVVSANFRPAYGERIYKLSELNGKVVAKGKTTDGESFYVPMVFEFDNIGDFVPGSYVEVFLIANTRKDVMSLPLSALTEEQGVYYVYVQAKGEQEAFLKKEVRTGQDNGERVEILSGLDVGDLVVVKGAYQVKLAASSTSVPEGHSH